MASIKEIVEREKQRNSIAECREIRLYKEGSFYHVYEWSAWLWHRHVNDYKLSHRLFKGLEQSVVLLGCPVPNLLKVIPDGFTLDEVSETKSILNVPESCVPDGYSIDLMRADFDNWKNTLPEAVPSISRKKDKGVDLQRQDDVSARPVRLTDITQSILKFNINRKTPFECMQFLSDIQQQLISII